MNVKVKLSYIAEEMDIQHDEMGSYLNRETGEVIMISEEEMRAVEDEKDLEDYPEWQRESILLAGEILYHEGEEHLLRQFFGVRSKVKNTFSGNFLVKNTFAGSF